MIKDLLNTYTAIFDDWIGEASKLKMKLKETQDPFLFKRFFIKTVEIIDQFDAIWTSLCTGLNDIFNIVGRFSKQYGLTPPPSFVILDEKSPDNTINIPIVAYYEELKTLSTRMKGRTEEKVLLPNLMIFSLLPTSKIAFNLFIEITEKYPNYPKKYSDLITNYQLKMLNSLKQTVQQLETSFEESPPPTLKEMQPLFQDLNTNLNLLNYYLPGRTYSIIEQKGSIYEHQIQLYQPYFQGQKQLKLLAKFFAEVNYQPSPDTSEFKDIQNQYSDLQTRIKLFTENLNSYAKIVLVEPKVLETLKKMDPEFPVFLPRLSELVEEEKKQTESALKIVLLRAPKIGKYDSMSQVLKFTKPHEVGNMIGNLLEQYPERSFEELIILLEKKEYITIHERSSLVNYLYNQIEASLNKKVTTTETIDLSLRMNLAFEQGIINENERELLHQFRKRRNEFIHDKGSSLPANLILETFSIQKRLSN